MIKIGIIGATGYAGVELIRILLNHPQAELAAGTGASGNLHFHMPLKRGHFNPGAEYGLPGGQGKVALQIFAVHLERVVRQIAHP